MSHHGQDGPTPEQSKIIDEIRRAQRAMQGEFPQGRLNKDDEGGLAMGLYVEDGKVCIRFPKPVAWIGFTPEQAMQIAADLIKHARAAGSKKPLTLTVGG